MTRWVGIGCLVAVLAILCVQPFVAPYDPMSVDLERGLAQPDRAHLLGTDVIGRDILARLAAGAWTSLIAALVAVAVSSVVGAGIGCIAGYAGGVADRSISAGVDLLLAFPRFVILLNLAAVFSFRTSFSLGLLIGLTSWMATARLVRTEVLSLRRRAFVEAAQASGAPGARILARHVIPHVTRLVMEFAGLRFASAILLAATLDYLGVGLPVDQPSWGGMIRDGQAYLREGPWIALPAVLMLCLATVGLVLTTERKWGQTPFSAKSS